MKLLYRLFKALADPRRLRILNLLLNEPRRVCELETALDLPEPLVSRHLLQRDRQARRSAHTGGGDRRPDRDHGPGAVGSGAQDAAWGANRRLNRREHRMRAGSFKSIILLANVTFPALLLGQQFPPPLREGSGRFRWSSYIQLRYTAVENDKDLFALRRLKLMIGGNLTPRLQWYAQGVFKDGNGTPTDGRAYFQEAWLRYAWRKEVQFAVGQFKPPFGRERFTPDFEIVTIDRSLVTDALTPDGPYIDSFYRDRGIQVDGEPLPMLRYAVGVFDGRGANHGLHGIGPLLVGQALLRPIRERPVAGQAFSLQLGGAYAARWGSDLPFRSCCREMENDLSQFRGADRRWQAEVSADWGNSSFRGEYMRAILRFRDPSVLAFPASGYYVQVSKYLAPRWQAVVKHEAFDPNMHIRNGKDVRQTTAGLNYYLRLNRVKVMAGYVHRSERAASVANDLVQIQLQYFIH